MAHKLDTDNPKQIKAIITDLDGVLTDGGMYYQSVMVGDIPVPSNPLAHLAFKKFHTRDASAAKWLKENTKVKLFVVTAGDAIHNNAINVARMRVMHLTEPIFCGVDDKARKVQDIAAKHGIDLDEVAYIGDDRIDLPALKIVGFPTCPLDSLHSVFMFCGDLMDVSRSNGGEGVLGDMIDHWLNEGLISATHGTPVESVNGPVRELEGTFSIGLEMIYCNGTAQPMKLTFEGEARRGGKSAPVIITARCSTIDIKTW